jgi:hypothetical protein
MVVIAILCNVIQRSSNGGVFSYSGVGKQGRGTLQIAVSHEGIDFSVSVTDRI